MSRIADSLKALKLERRELAARLTRMDRLIGGYETLAQLQPRRRRANGAGAKPRSKGAVRKPRKSAASHKKAPAGNLAAATE